MVCVAETSGRLRESRDKERKMIDMKSIRLLVLTMMVTAGALCARDDRGQSSFREDDILSLMRRVNDYTLTHPYRETDRNWIRGTWYSGVMEAYRATGDKRYLEQAQAWAERHEYQIGQERSGFNRLFCAMTWLELHQIDPTPQKINPTIEAIDADLRWSPTIGEIWYGHAPHQTSVKHIYADGYYSSSVFAMLHKATGEQKYLDFLHDAFWKGVETIVDTEEDLYYRDPGYIGKKSPYGHKIIWSRGNGWVFAGLARLIRDLPKDDPHYERYIDLFQRMAKSLAGRQQDDGFWRSNLDDPQHYTMPESSGTAFFLAGFGWGIREGVLDRETYLPVIIRGWQALVSAIHPDGFTGWVQPVDAQPRPSHPRTTQEYGAGLFLSAASEVYRLVKDGLITTDVIQASLPSQSQMLPPAALKDGSLSSREHPLNAQINTFLKSQQGHELAPTGLTKRDYLDVIAGQVKAMRQYQDAEGRIIDPVEKQEKYFTTPCYAHSVAVLANAGYSIDKETVESGMKALDASLKSIVAGKAAGSHGDFFTWPIVFAYELFQESASQARKEQWQQHLEQIDPERSYRVYRKPLAPSAHKDFYKAYASHFANNWNLVNVAGEWGRVKHGLGDPWYVDYCMTMQLPNFTPHGMYNEGGNPLPYDLFSRHYLTGMLQRGYSSFLHTTYRDILWRGAWTSLFMQSPFGEHPTGYRSSHHIWNEAEQAVIFEIYAAAYAKAGKTAEAGAFKRAARLSLESIKNWIRPDGSGYIVKNRYPIEAKHGYERYSVHTCYNMLAMSMLAQAWEFADDSIAEQPAPADVGGFVVPILTPFHKVFANACGNYVEHDPTADHKYNPTGLLRVHLKNGHPQLGPSDGCAPYFSGEGEFLAAGPAWRVDGKWTKLAECKGHTRKVTVLEETPQRVRFEVAYAGVSQILTVDDRGVTIEDRVDLDDSDAMRVYYPMLVSDGKGETQVEMEQNAVTLTLAGKSVTFEILEPAGATLQRTGKQLKHRNGLVEAVYAESTGKRMRYRISAK